MERQFTAFMRKPLTVRSAMGVIVTAMFLSVVLGGALIRLAEPQKFPNLGDGMWWAVQTVTTVGYGDAVPQSGLGRAVAAVFMVESIAFVSIVTAAITSSFVERVRRERMRTAAPTDPASVAAQVDEIVLRLERIERALAARPGAGPTPD
jgi:voltage-gated potassium channel